MDAQKTEDPEKKITYINQHTVYHFMSCDTILGTINVHQRTNNKSIAEVKDVWGRMKWAKKVVYHVLAATVGPSDSDNRKRAID